MRTLAELLSELGESHLALFIDRADDLRLTNTGREIAGDWAFGYLCALCDIGRISAEEYDALASEPRRRALAESARE
ncbi:hypothetical protein PSMEN_08280 [Ectopseudomonas mendocina]|jgi:hypothetical protein|nr:hypothetical protein PSMEN_08280 [Pseudomonas mendocina]